MRLLICLPGHDCCVGFGVCVICKLIVCCVRFDGLRVLVTVIGIGFGVCCYVVVVCCSADFVVVGWCAFRCCGRFVADFMLVRDRSLLRFVAGWFGLGMLGWWFWLCWW